MARFEILKFPHFVESKGTLTPFELDQNFPFEVKRVYFVTAPKKIIRGAHAHQIESELFVAISGSVMALVNDGGGDRVINLNSSSKALLVKNWCWHEFFDFSSDAVLACFSSTHYLPGSENYITEKNNFLDLCSKL